jgi:hypothetical protein
VFEILFFLAVALLATIPGAIARRKGHTFWKWWLFGVLLFIVALPASIFIKDWRRHCPHCGKIAPREASVCPHCQREIESYTLKPEITG